MPFKKETNEWISISDMMAGLMTIFLLITVSYMVVIQQSQKELVEKNTKLTTLSQQMTDVASSYKDLQQELNKDLLAEFSKDLKKWNAIIDENDTTIRFRDPDVLFDAGKSELRIGYKKILDDFFPRYMTIITNKKYKDDIEEVRIEGHTSDEWQQSDTFDNRYIQNVLLSQNRAYEVLKHCIVIKSPNIEVNKEWLVVVLRANGLSFAKPLEDRERSRRVEFRTVLKADKSLLKIMDISKEL